LRSRPHSVPAIQDPNNGDFVLWESGAIIEYLVETYDKESKLSFPAGSPESYLTKQWLYFQVSGQGPYFGQAAWFSFYHPEKLPSARERYINEIKRVTAVLNGALKEKEALVGNKVTFADLSFVIWYQSIKRLEVDGTGLYDVLCAANPDWKRWMDSLMARPAIEKVMKDKAAAAAGH
jgi:glutathione S-transferase